MSNGIQNNLTRIYDQIGITQSVNPLNIENQRENPDSYLAKIQECEALINSLQTQLASPSVSALQQSNPQQAASLTQALQQKIQELTQLSKTYQDKLSSSLGSYASINSQYANNRLSLTNTLAQSQNGLPLAVSEVYLNAINNRPNNNQLENVLATI